MKKKKTQQQVMARALEPLDERIARLKAMNNPHLKKTIQMLEEMRRGLG